MARGKKLTTEEFIHKAIAVHGDRYDYTGALYDGMQKKIKITCKTHGIFEKEPGNHLKGQGCTYCRKKSTGNRYRKSKDDFITDSIAVHGNKYDYSLVEYKSTNKKVKIICKIHGIFEQIAAGHLRYSGCQGCNSMGRGKSHRKQTNDFLSEAKIIHGDRYDYSNVKYKNRQTKIKITCKTHGVFEQRPHNHLCGNGCPDCGARKQLNSEGFIRRAIAVHGDKYDYSLVDYKSTKGKVKVICNIHGIFKQTAADHLNRCGCPSCAKTSFSYKDPAILYYIKFESKADAPLYKIGITNNNNVAIRIKSMKPINGIKWTILETLYFENGSEAYDLEQLLHQEYAEHKYYGDPIMDNGNTELFVKDVMAIRQY